MELGNRNMDRGVIPGPSSLVAFLYLQQRLPLGPRAAGRPEDEDRGRNRSGVVS